MVNTRVRLANAAVAKIKLSAKVKIINFFILFLLSYSFTKNCQPALPVSFSNFRFHSIIAYWLSVIGLPPLLLVSPQFTVSLFYLLIPFNVWQSRLHYIRPWRIKNRGKPNYPQN
jgi:hypothetical protein